MMRSAPPEEPAPVAQTLRSALFDELEAALDSKLLHLVEREWADAETRLRPVIVRLQSARAELSKLETSEEATGEFHALGALAGLLRQIVEPLAELDFIGRLNRALTDVQITALELGWAVDLAAPDPLRASTEAAQHGDDTSLAALRSVAEDLPGALKEPYRRLLVTAIQRHADVASAATRCAHEVRSLHRTAPQTHVPVTDDNRGLEEVEAETSKRSEPAQSFETLETHVTALADWLVSEPMEEIRAAVQALVSERAAPDWKGRSAKRRRRDEDVVKRVRERWDRYGRPERIWMETARLQYVIGVAEFGTFLDGFVRTDLLSEADEVARRAIQFLSSAAESLRDLHREAESNYEEASGSGPIPRRLLDSGLAAIGAAQSGLTDLAQRSRALEAATDSAAAIADQVGRLAQKLRVGRRLEVGAEVSVDDDGVGVEPREWAQDAFGVFLLERLRDSALPYAEGLRSALELVPNAQAVLDYNLGAAIDVAEESNASVTELQRELVLGGLDRTADRLTEAIHQLEEARRSAPLAAELVLDEAAEEFWLRVEAEHSLEGRARDLFATLSHGAGRAGAWAGRGGARLRQSTTALFRQGSARALGTLRRARIAVGADPVASERVDATVRMIADVDAVAGDLPFVYRRLFSYRPATDESLLVGREAQCAALDDHLERWRAGVTDALLVAGSSGVGVSSLINVTQRRWGDAVEWCSIELIDRVTDEAEWAGTLANALGLDPAVEALSELQTILEQRPDPDKPQVCVIDNCELLYRRGVLDPGLIGPTLRLMSATDACVFWIAPLAASAWQVLTALQPGAAALVRVVSIEPLTRDDIEAAVLARHQRSGIPLRMETPADTPMGVRRALSKAKDDEHQQAILRGAFFDRLFALSDGYMALATLYWLRSLRLDSETEVMHIGWPETIDFGAWDDLEPTGAFALRALLEHGSLTLAEYQQVFGVGRDQAYSAFERLGNLLLIEPVGPVRRPGTRLRFRRINPDARYRIRPVLVRPVERLLTSRRLLY